MWPRSIAFSPPGKSAYLKAFELSFSISLADQGRLHPTHGPAGDFAPGGDHLFAARTSYDVRHLISTWFGPYDREPGLKMEISVIGSTQLTFGRHRFPISIKGIILDGQKVVLLKNERDEWEPPGGKLELGEAPEDYVSRETE